MLQGLLIARDELLRRRLQTLLLGQGFAEVLTAADSHETVARLRRLTAGARLVVLDADGWIDADDEWNRVIAALEEPVRSLQIPLLVVGSESAAALRAHLRSEGQLHYSYLRKPFNQRDLLAGILRAAERLLLYSQPLIYFGTGIPSGLRDELTLGRRGFHAVFEFASTAATLQEKIESLQGGPAIVLLDPLSPISSEEIRWLRRFKMTPAGRRCRMVCLSRAASEIVPLRRLAEVFWDPSGSWLAFLHRIAASQAQSVYCDLLAETAKKDLLDGRLRSAGLRVSAGLKADPYNLRLHALKAEIAVSLGRHGQAMREYQTLLWLNPCLPQGYLGLWDFVRSEERPGLMRKALDYCPRHPEIRSRSS